MAQDNLQIWRDALDIWVVNLRRDFERFWDATWGTYTELLRKIIMFEIPGGTFGLGGYALDSLISIIDGATTFLSAVAMGPFLAIAEALLVNFENKQLRQRVVSLDKAVSAVGLLIIERGRTVVLNPGSTFLSAIQFALKSSGWQKKLLDILLLRVGKILQSRLTRLARSITFLILQLIVILGQFGFAAGMALVVLTLKNDAEKSEKLLSIPAFRQDKPRIYERGSHRTRKPGP